MQGWQSAAVPATVDLSAAEARLLAFVRRELSEADRRIVDLDDLVFRIGNETARIRTDVNTLESGVSGLRTELQQVALERGGPGGLK
jgi:hypothetical protein